MTTAYDAPIPYDSPIGYDGGVSVVTSDELPTWTLDAFVPLGDNEGALGPLPEASIDQMSFEASAPSAISFSIPQGSKNYELCDYYTIVNLKANGQPVRDGRWLLRGKGWNAGEVGQIRKFTGRHLLWDRLFYTVIRPGVRKTYNAKSPGYILDELFTEAQNRDVGYWSEFTWTFTAQHDSNGQSWPFVLGNMEYLPSAKYSDIVANMVDKGLIEVHLMGNEIQIFVAKTAGVFRSALLVLGNDLTDAPQQGTVEGILSDVVVLGEEGTGLVRSNPNTAAKYWREEGGVSQGGTNDAGTLSIFGDVALSKGDAPRVQRTYGLVVTQDRPFLPVRDYGVDDWVRVQHSDEGEAEPLLVKQIVLKQDKGIWAGSLVLNDKFIENDIRLAKKVDGILGGATITGSAQQSTPDNLKDTGVPAKMTGLNVTSESYQNNEGITKAVVTATWDLVTLNVDGSTATDMGTYFVAWRYNDAPTNTWVEQQVSHPQNWLSWGNLDPGREVLVYVYSKDNSGNQGSWTGIESTLTQTDSTPPPQPSNPLTASIAKQFIVEWDGLAESGATMPPDFDHIDVYSGHSSGFDPESDGDLHATMTTAGQVFITPYAYSIGDTAYFRFVAVDRSGNRSDASPEQSQVLVGITGPDLTANSVTTNALAAGAVTTLKLAAGAVTTEKINIGQTQNLLPDPSFNNAEWRARRLTTDWAERPDRWFFRNDLFARNGYWLQALSTTAGENGGRMYMCDWISTMLGESYYFGMYMMTGQNLPNSEATMTMGVEVTCADGTILSDGINYSPMPGIWTKYGYRFTIADSKWVKVRFFLRANNLTTGDIAIDDVELRGGVGTTAATGSRGLIDPLGLYAWDAAETQTFLLDFRTGDFTAKGTIQSGFTGKRIVINPGTTYLPEIRFYPETGDLYAYINASNSGSYPFIGMNAPDTGTIASAVILFDDGWQIGEINKSNGSVSGPGIQGNGVGNSGYIDIRGKLSGIATNSTFDSYRFNLGGVVAGQTTINVVLTKPPAAISGHWHCLYSVQRNGTGQRFTHHITSDSGTQTAVGMYTASSSTNDAIAFTNVTTYIAYLFVRADGDA